MKYDTLIDRKQTGIVLKGSNQRREVLKWLFKRIEQRTDSTEQKNLPRCYPAGGFFNRYRSITPAGVRLSYFDHQVLRKVFTNLAHFSPSSSWEMSSTETPPSAATLRSSLAMAKSFSFSSLMKLWASCPK